MKKKFSTNLKIYETLHVMNNEYLFSEKSKPDTASEFIY